MQMVIEGCLGKKKKRKACLARGEKLLAAFLVVQGRPTCGWWWQRRLRLWQKRWPSREETNWGKELIFS